MANLTEPDDFGASLFQLTGLHARSPDDLTAVVALHPDAHGALGRARPCDADCVGDRQRLGAEPATHGLVAVRRDGPDRADRWALAGELTHLVAPFDGRSWTAREVQKRSATPCAAG